MRLGFFTMPMHPPHRNWVETLKEDRQSFILADKLGFYDAFCGEHIADVIENVTNSFQFLATLIQETRPIKLATGTANLSQTHPVLIAAHAAMFDHLAEGRFVLGVSAGALPADAELLGTWARTAPRIFHEAVDAIFALWTTDAPYNFDQPTTASRFPAPRWADGSSVSARSPSRIKSPIRKSSARSWRRARAARRYFGNEGHSPAVGEFPAAEMAEVALGCLPGRGEFRRRAGRPG